MKKPSDERVAEWIDKVATYRRTLLPHDHPNRLNYGGAPQADLRTKAKRASSQLHEHGLHNDAEIDRVANGGVDIEKVRAEKRAAHELWELRAKVAAMVGKATESGLRAAVKAMEDT